MVSLFDRAHDASRRSASGQRCRVSALLEGNIHHDPGSSKSRKSSNSNAFTYFSRRAVGFGYKIDKVYGWWYMALCSVTLLVRTIIVRPHLLVRVTSERFPPARVTFRSVLANESHWLQPLLVLTVRWWPDTNKCGRAIRVDGPILVSSSHLYKYRRVGVVVGGDILEV